MSAPPPFAPASGLRFARNAGWNMVGQTLPLLAAMGALPVVVRELGPERFGLLALVWLVLGYFNLFDLGLGRATVKQVAESLGTGDLRGAGAVARTSVAAHAALGIAATFALYQAVPWLADTVFRVEPAFRAETQEVLRVLAGALPFVLVMNAHRSVLEGFQHFGTVNVLKVPFSTALYVMPLVGTLAGWTLTGIVAAMALTRVAAALAFAVASRSAARRLGAPGAFDTARLTALVRFGGWVGLSNTVIPLLVYLDRVVITAVHSLEALAYYVGAYEIATKALLVPIAVSGAALPLFSGAHAAGRQRLAARTTDAARLVMVLVTPLTIALILCAGPLLAVYLGPDYARAATAAFVLLNLAVFINALAFPFSALVEGVGRPDILAKYHVVELPIYFAVLLLLTRSFGIFGAAAAWLLRMGWMAPILALLAVRAAALGWEELNRHGLARDALLACGAAAAAAALWLALRPGWTLAALLGAALIAAFLLAHWFVCFGERERTAVHALLRRATPPR